MKIWHISDTHNKHWQLVAPEGIDVVIHSGDASNWLDPYRNESEMRSFIEWFAALPIPNKIFVPGNHDTSVEKGLISRDWIEGLGINLLIDQALTLNGIKFWGTPWTPRYGSWAYMKDRGTINRVWERIPDDIDVLICHGPPYGVLDATYSRENKVELCGDGALQKRVAKMKLKLMCFGHIHSTHDIRNAGTRTVSGMATVFSNGACCDDGKMEMLTSRGNILEVV
jgi:Icc-related predicted phosphoesterase